MALILTAFVITAIRDFRRELQQIYLHYLMVGRESKDVYHYMQKTILIKGLGQDVKGENIMEGINNYLTENCVKGRMISMKTLPDCKTLYDLKVKKTWYELYREMYEKKVFNCLTLKLIG